MELLLRVEALQGKRREAIQGVILEKRGEQLFVCPTGVRHTKKRRNHSGAYGDEGIFRCLTSQCQQRKGEGEGGGIEADG